MMEILGTYWWAFALVFVIYGYAAAFWRASRGIFWPEKFCFLIGFIHLVLLVVALVACAEAWHRWRM